MGILKQNMQGMLEEKIQIKAQIEKLNKMYVSRENNIQEFKEVYGEFKNALEAKQAFRELDGFLDKSVKTCEKEAKASECKQKFRSFRKSLGLLAKEIKTELDVFQVCFNADAESIFVKVFQATAKKEIKGKVSETFSSESPEEVCEKCESEVFSQIKFGGITKKNKKK